MPRRDRAPSSTTTTGSATPVLVAQGIVREVRQPDGKTLLILGGVDVTVMPGEKIAIMGRSGSGKTTLLAIFGLLSRPTSGTVSILGTEARTLSDRARSAFRNRTIGFVFQSYSLIRHLTAYQNVELPLRYGTRAVAHRRARVRDSLALVGLADKAKARPKHLSGGEQQRVAIARALIREPSLILADEPTGALDVDTAALVLDALIDACRVRGCALVVVTHDPVIAARMDRTVHLSGGLVVSEATV